MRLTALTHQCDGCRSGYRDQTKQAPNEKYSVTIIPVSPAVGARCAPDPAQAPEARPRDHSGGQPEF